MSTSPQPAESDDLLDVVRTRQKLGGISYNTLKKIYSDPRTKLRPVRITSRRIMFRREDVDAFIAWRQANPAPKVPTYPIPVKKSA